MGLEGVRAILKELADPKRNPNHLLVPALIVTSAVLGDFSVDYIARMRERAKGELERERLAQLEAKLRKAYE